MLFPGLADYSDWGLLALRLAVAAIFLVHGQAKATGARKMLESMGQATPARVAQTTIHGWVEVLGGIALAVGFLTQLVAIVFGIIMVGAIALKNTQWKTGFMAMQTTGWEFDLVLLAASLVLLFGGPGALAIQG
jgi:uncharacterized membrane protein YphA (DoxX/SURF4 family)